jgi:uncharacterized surface protein with fasciclin (FAS1) repeats
MLRRIMLASSALTAVTTVATGAPLDLDFQDGIAGWRTVLDGVMGGLSTGRVSQPEPGMLLFTGELSLDNNGGFSQIRTNVPEGALAGTSGVEFRVRGDGRTYTFDIRCSHVRLMAGAFQSEFTTENGVWQTIRIPFDDFQLYNFGRRVSNALPLLPDRIESIGMTLGDKKAGPFRLEIDAIRALGTDDRVTTGNDLVSVATDAGLTTLLELATAADIMSVLPQGERLTIFAPTNEAFAALPREKVEALLTPEGLSTLRTILAHHVATPALPSAKLLDRRSVTTLSGQRVNVSTEGAITIGGAKVIATDVPFDGGVVHVIDRVMMPETRTIDRILAEDRRLSTLAAAVEAADLTRQLGPANDGPWTILAPTNQAFAALPDGALEQLLTPEGRSTLVAILAGHVVPGRLYRSDLVGAGSAQTLATAPVAYGLKDGLVTIGGANIVVADVPAANGVIHVIDRVILPAPETPASASAAAAAPFDEAISLMDRAVAIGAPLFNDGNVEACAATYEMTILCILELSSDRLGNTLMQRFQRALAEGQAEDDARERAWIYRRAMDEAFERLAAQASTQATAHMQHH